MHRKENRDVSVVFTLPPPVTIRHAGLCHSHTLVTAERFSTIATSLTCQVKAAMKAFAEWLYVTISLYHVWSLLTLWRLFTMTLWMFNGNSQWLCSSPKPAFIRQRLATAGTLPARQAAQLDVPCDRQPITIVSRNACEMLFLCLHPIPIFILPIPSFIPPSLPPSLPKLPLTMTVSIRGDSCVRAVCSLECQRSLDDSWNKLTVM